MNKNIAVMLLFVAVFISSISQLILKKRPIKKINHLSGII
mgnify:CR=1 FL=1